MGYTSRGTSNEEGRFREFLHGIKHRGPDSSGVWSDPSTGIYFGHTRLSILDLSPAGHQPMISASGNYIIVFNGEIYNFTELKMILRQRGYTFAGGSDTEVILAAVEEWGAHDAIHRLEGMFAIGLWDRREQKLLLARDRVGIKPLYYGWHANHFFFASELKPFVLAFGDSLSVNQDAAALMCKLGFVPDPFSIFKGVYKLPPGCSLELRGEDLFQPPLNWSPNVREGRGSRGLTRYWAPRKFHNEIAPPVIQRGIDEVVADLDAKLSRAVKRQLMSDVPIGALLSGGIDSSLVVSYAQRFLGDSLSTFSIGFTERSFDEVPFARSVAAHLGVKHLTQYVGSSDLLSFIPRLPRIYDEPFGDPSQLTMCIVSEFARRHVKVVLSGDGGDEVFCGYNRYVWGERMWRHGRRLPRPVRQLFVGAMNLLAAEKTNHLFEKLGGLLGADLFPPSLGDKLNRLGEVLGCKSSRELYYMFVDKLLFLDRDLGDIFWMLEDGAPIVEGMMSCDFDVGLPGDMLTKVDRASMYFGLEVRVPLLDEDIIAAAGCIPFDMKLRHGEGKWILRRLLARSVPRKLWDRPKRGFGIPLDRWLRNEMAEWASERLHSNVLPDFLERPKILKMWNEHVTGQRNWQYGLWNVLMLIEWKQWLRREQSDGFTDRLIA